MLVIVDFFFFWCTNVVTCNEPEWSIYRLNGPHEIITQINLINWVHNSDVVGVTR